MKNAFVSGTYLKNQACDEIGFSGMQRTFTTMAGRGFEKHCTLSTEQKTVAKLVFGIYVVPWLHMKEHISKTRHVTKFVLEICDARWWAKSTIWVWEVHGFWDTYRMPVSKLVFEICVARLRQCQWNISKTKPWPWAFTASMRLCVARWRCLSTSVLVLYHWISNSQKTTINIRFQYRIESYQTLNNFQCYLIHGAKGAVAFGAAAAGLMGPPPYSPSPSV